MNIDVNLLATGIYSVLDAARLVRASKQRVRGWVTGWPRRQLPPIIDNELPGVEDRVAFSFTNLMEIRFIAFFEDIGIEQDHAFRWASDRGS